MRRTLRQRIGYILIKQFCGPKYKDRTEQILKHTKKEIMKELPKEYKGKEPATIGQERFYRKALSDCQEVIEKVLE